MHYSAKRCCEDIDVSTRKNQAFTLPISALTSTCAVLSDDLREDTNLNVLSTTLACNARINQPSSFPSSDSDSLKSTDGCAGIQTSLYVSRIGPVYSAGSGSWRAPLAGQPTTTVLGKVCACVYVCGQAKQVPSLWVDLIRQTSSVPGRLYKAHMVHRAPKNITLNPLGTEDGKLEDKKIDD